MQIPRTELIKWLARTFQFESGEHREMLRMRIEDLAHRGIDDDSLEMYLKSAGFNPEIASVYREFKTHVAQQQQSQKEKDVMSEEMISKTQAKQALRQMLRELAQAAGYDFKDTDDLATVRTNFVTYLRALQATADLDLSGTDQTDTVEAQSAALALSYLKEAEKVLNDALTAR